MASNKPATATAAPAAEAPQPPTRPAKPPDRRLRLEDILKLMVADGLVSAADAELLSRSRTQRFETVLELIADRKWRSLSGTKKLLTLDALVEWLAARLKIPYHHIDPLKIDLVGVTQTMSNAYAERYRILPVAVTTSVLTVATSEPFVRAWADELEQILHKRIELVFANPQDIRRYVGEFFTLARSMKKAQETSRGEVSLPVISSNSSSSATAAISTPTTSVVHIVDWLAIHVRQRASDIHLEPRRGSGVVRFRIDGVLHQVYAIPIPRAAGHDERIKLLAHGDRGAAPAAGRTHQDGVAGGEIELRISTMPTAFGEKSRRIFTSIGARLQNRLRQRGSRRWADGQAAVRDHLVRDPRVRARRQRCIPQ